jgi:hypothetical protein
MAQINRQLSANIGDSVKHFFFGTHKKIFKEKSMYPQSINSENIDLMVQKEEDWNQFAQENLDVIIDPMVFRSGHLLLRGKSGIKDTSGSEKPESVWKALSQNIGSLVAFFDALILNEHLPIIDYGYTFESYLGYQADELVQLCNQEEKILHQVHVMGNAYSNARADAIAALNQRKQIEPDLVASIEAEMSAFDYDWNPTIPGLELLTSEGEKAVRQFMFTGLLFSAYAQRTGAGHLLQPKRSRSYLAVSLVEGFTQYGDEQKLFEAVKKIANEAVGSENAALEIDPLPPFLPYLLNLLEETSRAQKAPKTPTDLLQKALALRKVPAVSDYRNWRAQLVRTWRDVGKIDRAHEKSLKKIIQAVMKEIQGQNGPSPEWEAKTTFMPVPPFAQAEISVHGELPLDRLWGWTLGKLPGRRYSKLLMRMMLADHEYRLIDHGLRTIWNKG